MSKEIKDLTKAFSDIELKIILEFAEELEVERFEKSFTSQGFEKYEMNTGLTEIEVSVFSSNEERELLLVAKNIEEGKHFMSNDRITNPSLLITYFNILKELIQKK